MTSLAEELNLVDETGRKSSRSLLPAQDSCEMDSSPEDIDSGHFTMRDVHECYSDEESFVLPTKARHEKASIKRQMYRCNSAIGSQAGKSPPSCNSYQGSRHSAGGGCALSGSTKLYRDHGTEMDNGSSGVVCSCSHCSHLSTVAVSCSSNIPDCPASPTVASRTSPAAVRRISHASINCVPRKPVAHEAERIFKIVLAGDAAVGKSSFIMRLCKNKFVTNLNSTLGVDFQTKTLEVGGRVIALQLWDTAGQERFRSIAKSYFRRADGVLLLYDVTYERSFLNVRDWLEAIEEGAQKQLPIMLVGNKCDLRPDLLTAGDNTKTFVRMEDGQRLAREFQGLFIESSAKDGRNVLEAVTELSRMLMANEDLEVQSIGLKLQDATSDAAGKKIKSPCCNL
jgi:Ras and EF-hand domain-containing protein